MYDYKFLLKCQLYGIHHPLTNKESVVWHTCLTDKQRKRNEELVNGMLDWGNRPEMFVSEENYPCFYYNGFKAYRKKQDGTIFVDKTDDIPFADPRLLPKIIVSDDIAYRFNEYLNTVGYYMECWSYGYYHIAANCGKIPQDEFDSFAEQTSNIRPKDIGRWSNDVPFILLEIRDKWSNLSAETGDIGSVVIGAGIRFDYDGQKYNLIPCSPWQGEGSWKPHVDFIKQCLMFIGATDIKYERGILD